MGQTLRQIGLLVGAFLLLVVFFREPLKAAGHWFYDTVGVWGAFIGVFLSDSIGIPIVLDIYLAAAVAAEEPTLPVLVAGCAGSVLGGCAAYFLGVRFYDWQWLRERLAPLEGEKLFEKWGVTAVAIAAWTPLPFSVTCWLAGMFRMPFGRFFLTTLHRIPRALVTYALLQLGWTAATSAS